MKAQLAAPHETAAPSCFLPSATTRSNAPGARIFNLPLQLISRGIPTELQTSAQVTAALKPHWCFNIYAPYVMSVDRPRTHMKAYLVRPSVIESIGPALDPPQKAPHENGSPFVLPTIRQRRVPAPGARIFDLPLQLISSGIPTELQTAAQVTAGLKPHWRFNIYAPICGDMHPYEGLPRSTECKRVYKTGA